MKTEQVILYGAGGNAFNGLRLCKYNFEPMCFVESDESKQGLIFKNTNLKIMSPQDAKNAFPNAKWFITVRRHQARKEIQESLISSGLAAIEDIVNPITSLTYKRSCYWIEETLGVLDSQDLNACGGGRLHKFDKAECFYPWREPDESIDGFLEMRNNYLKKVNMEPKKSSCYGCSLFCDEYWADYRIYHVIYSTTPFSVCNFKCHYCVSGKFGDVSHCDNSYTHSFTELVEALEKRNLISPLWTTLQFSNGEITVDPNRNELYKLTNRYFSHFFINGSNYSPEIDRLLKEDKTHVIISVDAGTEATFKRVKKVNLFNKVCKNIERYASEGGNRNLSLKYIFIPDETDGTEDFLGFVRLCDKIKPMHITISMDFNMDCNDMEYKYIERLFELVDKLMISGHELSFQGSTSFTDNEKKRLLDIAKANNAEYFEKLESYILR